MTGEQGPETLKHNGSSLTIWRDAPSWDGKRTAALGKLRVAEMADGRALIETAQNLLGDEGFEAVIGPMDGDTWHAYRAVTESDGSQPFLMEPTSGPHDVPLLAASRFEPISTYLSSRVATREAIGERPVLADGVEIINWDGQSPETFFGEVYDFSVEGFARNAFYKPISRDEFLGLYVPYVPILKRELIFFARSGGQLVGFLFGIPNYAEGPQTRTAILKTYASSMRGVGHALADTFHRNALELGYETTIHALIHDDNISRQRSSMHGATVFRRYTLFGRQL